MIRRLRNGARVFYANVQWGPAHPPVDHWRGVPESERLKETAELPGGTVLTTYLGTAEQDGAARLRRPAASAPAPAAPAPPLLPFVPPAGATDDKGRWRLVEPGDS